MGRSPGGRVSWYAGVLVGRSAGGLHGFLSGLSSSSPGGLSLGALSVGELLVDGGRVGFLCAVALGLGGAVGWVVSTWRFRSLRAMLLLVSTGWAYSHLEFGQHIRCRVWARFADVVCGTLESEGLGGSALTSLLTEYSLSAALVRWVAVWAAG